MAGENGLGTLVCDGPSMQPTLRSGDILQISPYRGKRIRRADIIVFQHPRRNHPVAHRVVMISPLGIKTRGDNNFSRDALDIPPENVLGRVVSFNRGNINYQVPSGFFGEICLAKVKAGVLINKSFSLLLGPGYRWLGERGIIFRFTRLFLQPRQIKIQGKSGEERYLVFGKLIVARLPPGERKWRIRKPFRLFIDKKYQ